MRAVTIVELEHTHSDKSRGYIEMRTLAIERFENGSATTPAQDRQQLISITQNAAGRSSLVRRRLPYFGRRRARQRLDVAIELNGVDECIFAARNRGLFVTIDHELAPPRACRVRAGRR